MFTEEVPAVVTVTSRLRDVLDKARKLKNTTTIEPSLPLNEIAADTSHISQIVHTEPVEPDAVHPPPSSNHAAFETAARNIFYSTLATNTIDSPSFADVWNLLDIVQSSADHGQCDPGLALWLVEELLDSQTIDGCRRVFDYLESRRERLITNGFNKNKQLIVLRSCNELLRRLSRAEDAVFCGRVFIFLFQSFPLGDKSAVNLRGEFHIENTTTFEIPEPEPREEANGDIKMNDEETSEPIEKNEDDTQPGEESAPANEHNNQNGLTSPTIATKTDTPKPTEDSTKAVSFDEGTKQDEEEIINDDAFYVTFWSLQHIFSNPTRVFSPEEFSNFKKGLDQTFKKFKSKSVVRPKDDYQRDKEGDLKRKRSHDEAEFASTFNPKYLTSRDLFDLEMSDLTFQRHVLVQCLIIIDFLLSLTAKNKKKMTELKAQKAMMYNYTLSDEDTTWAWNTRKTIANYLQEDQDGRIYYRMVDNVLSRDKNWVRWKMESCPLIAKEPVRTENYLEARTNAKRACTNRRLKAIPTGAVDMSFVSDTSNVNDFDKLRDPDRFSIPSAETMLKDIQNIDLDLEMASPYEARELNERRANQTWKILRVAARNRFNLLEKIDENNSKTLDILTDVPKQDSSMEVDAAHDPENPAEGTVATDQPGEAELMEADVEAPTEQVPGPSEEVDDSNIKVDTVEETDEIKEDVEMKGLTVPTVEVEAPPTNEEEAEGAEDNGVTT